MGALDTIVTLLGITVLLPLVSFGIIVLFGPKMGPKGKYAAYVACAAIGSGFILSVIALGIWLNHYGLPAAHVAESHANEGHAEGVRSLFRGESSDDVGLVSAKDTSEPVRLVAASEGGEEATHHPAVQPPYLTGSWWPIYDSGGLRLEIGYFIDSLTLAMFCMVTLIATCVHVYAMGYMHDELHEFTDHEVTLSGGTHLKRPGRYHRFFQYLSLFSFSMLGLVIAGNLFMVFVFWELVGICSYFLIGFYIERKSASNAANKAFIVNRVGDFGMLIGLMALWASVGTFAFGDVKDAEGNIAEAGIFSRVRPAENDYRLTVPDGMVRVAQKEEVAALARTHAVGPEQTVEPELRAAAEAEIAGRVGAWREAQTPPPGYWLLVVAGIGIFCGCVGKSAQFPLHVWLPDAMEGPTPVSALVHSATMVAAGVYLVGRFYPVFAPEALLVIAVIGCFTLFMAATIALVATDIKRVLAYSTLSQLGYMMFALGIGGWVAGMLHLITHAFFKSLLFLGSGSVIHAVHSNEMTDMGGLIKKMPITAWTMFIGCLAIIGAGLPLVIGLSGYYSKDAIIAQGLLFREQNALWGPLALVAVAGAALTAFYMFRLWFMTFLGEPRDSHRYDHAHESPRVMTWPLILLAVLAVIVATPPITTLMEPSSAYIVRLLEHARPAGTGAASQGVLASIIVPEEHASHAPEIHIMAGLIAFATAAAGVLVACVIYWWRKLDPGEISQQFRPIYRFLRNKWWFDELYDTLFVRPTLFIASRVAAFDRAVIDWIIDGTARVFRMFATAWDTIVDRGVVDGTLNTLARKTWDAGLSLRRLQTGQLRLYVMSIVIGTIVLFVAISAYWNFVTSA